MIDDDPPRADKLVPLSELIALAQLGRAMRAAQKTYFARRKASPTDPCLAELRAAGHAERRFDRAAHDALNRERPALPGMDGS